MTERDNDGGTRDELRDEVAEGRTTAPPGAARDELDEEEELAEDRGPGFDPEQRRFLWTITAVLVLAMFASSGINIAYMDRQRARQIAANRAADEYRVTDEGFTNAQQVDIRAMVQALKGGDKQTYDQAMNHLMSVYQARQRAYVEMRHEQGLDEQVPDPSGADFAGIVEARVKQIAAQDSGQRPATTQSGATRPAAAPQGPAAPPIGATPPATQSSTP